MLSKDIMAKLSLPFAPDDVSWLPGRTTKDGSKVQAMAYADYRAYMNRLDEVCGPNWMIHFSPWGERIICELTVDGITRSSTGEPDSNSERNEIGGTVAEAQAMKRACAMFGLGRYLYNLPSVWVEYDAQRKQITDKARAELEQRYRTWYAKASQTRTDAPGRATPNHAATAPKAPQRPAAPVTVNVDEVDEVEPDGVTADNPFADAPPDIPQRGQPVTENTLKRLHALGKEAYGDAWATKRPELVTAASQGAVTSSKDLTENEARKLIRGMEAKIAQAQQPDAALRQQAA